MRRVPRVLALSSPRFVNGCSSSACGSNAPYGVSSSICQTARLGARSGVESRVRSERHPVESDPIADNTVGAACRHGTGTSPPLENHEPLTRSPA